MLIVLDASVRGYLEVVLGQLGERKRVWSPRVLAPAGIVQSGWCCLAAPAPGLQGRAAVGGSCSVGDSQRLLLGRSRPIGGLWRDYPSRAARCAVGRSGGRYRCRVLRCSSGRERRGNAGAGRGDTQTADEERDDDECLNVMSRESALSCPPWARQAVVQLFRSRSSAFAGAAFVPGERELAVVQTGQRPRVGCLRVLVSGGVPGNGR